VGRELRARAQLNWRIKHVFFNMEEVGQHSLHEQYWTPRLRRAVAKAASAMSDFNRSCLDTLLLTYGLISLGGIPYTVLANAGITSEKVTDALKGSVDVREEVFRYDNVVVADSVEVAFSNAQDRTRQLKHTYIGTDHALLALLGDASGTARPFFDARVSRQTLSAQLIKELTG
jgi:ATP-dependent Clp protease ATP-binding subunit ClpA